MNKKSKTQSAALQWFHDRFAKNDPEMQTMMDEERVNADVAQKIYDLRTGAGLSQRELAKRVGTTASVICRLEDADYDGHSLSVLRRIAEALNHRVEIRILPRLSRAANRNNRTRKKERDASSPKVG